MADGQGNPFVPDSLAPRAFPDETRAARFSQVRSLMTGSLIAVMLGAAALSVLGLIVMAVWRIASAIPIPAPLLHLLHRL